MEYSQHRHRRSVLRAGVLGGVTLLAGCVGSGHRSDGQNGQTTPAPKGVFESISFEGQNLVGHLQDDHDVTQVNLIAPDGTAFAEQSVASGATTVRLQILDMRFGIAGYEHYTPGEHELVAISEDNTESMPLPLEPDLRVVNIRQYRDGDDSIDLSKLEIDIENTGSGPTWIFDITYQNAPNWTENQDLVDDPGLPRIEGIESEGDLILLPQKSQTVIGTSEPFLFFEEEMNSCSRTIEATVLVGVATGKTLEQQIRATIGGEAHPVGLRDEFTCENVSVEMIDDGGQNE